MADSQLTRLTVTHLEDRLTPTDLYMISPAIPNGIVVSGGGPGSSPMVQVYFPDGSLRAQFLAYDAAFTGGVNVAVADVNADGVTDVITAAGAGGGPHVKVFDGNSVRSQPHPENSLAVVVPLPTELYSFFAYGAAFRGGVSVASGDVDADGYADIVTGAGAGGGPHVKVFSGKSGAEVRSFFAFDAAFRGGVNVAVGELQERTPETTVLRAYFFNSNGRIEHDDVVTYENADILVGSGAGMKATVTGFNGRTAEQFFTINPYGDFRGGAYVASGDITGDGFDDVITGAGAGGGPHVTVWDGYTLGHLASILLEGGPQPIRSFFAFDPGFGGGVRVGANDLDNNTVTDILAAAGPGGGPHIKAFSGSSNKELFSQFKWNVTPDTPGYAAGSSIAAAYTPNRPQPTAPIRMVSAFGTGSNGWTAGFSDFNTLNNPSQMALDSGIRPLPAELGQTVGYMLTGNNSSSDLFMYLKKNVGAGNGVAPNTSYRADFSVTFGSDVPAGLIGGGGPPAESVSLKVGGGATEPTTVTAQPNEIRLNVDKGNQRNSGTYATVIGDIANGLPPTLTSSYTSVTRTGSHVVRSDADGNLWLMVGTDSGFTGRTTLYYQVIDVTLTPVV